MKRFNKSMLGVTLLEIMLVLAIAAMVIVMSVRYYQSASANQQANSVLQIIQGITAQADGLAQGSGSYATGGVATGTVAPLLPGGAATITSPWGSQITITAATANTYLVTIPAMPVQVCLQLRPKLLGNPKYTNPSACGAAPANFTYTYNSQS